MLVLDCSVTMAWLFEDERCAYTESILDQLTEDEEALVPGLWLLEVSNVLLVAERKKRVTEAQAHQFWELLSSLPIHIKHTDTLEQIQATHAIAREHHLTTYDAAYLSLAMNKGIKIASLDKNLLKAAKTCGVECIKQ